eukprot:7538285-Pyramimonas_sp.AAC.2
MEYIFPSNTPRQHRRCEIVGCRDTRPLGSNRGLSSRMQGPLERSCNPWIKTAVVNLKERGVELMLSPYSSGWTPIAAAAALEFGESQNKSAGETQGDTGCKHIAVCLVGDGAMS